MPSEPSIYFTTERICHSGDLFCRASGREPEPLRLCSCCGHNCNECAEAPQGLETAEACSAWGLPWSWKDQLGGSTCESFWEPSGQDQPFRTNGSEETIKECLLTRKNLNGDFRYKNVLSLAGHYRFVWSWSPRGGREGGRVCMARWSPIGCIEGWSLGSLRRGKIQSIVFKYSKWLRGDAVVTFHVIFLPVEPCVPVGVGRTECLLWSPSRDLHPWAGHELPSSAWEDQDFCLPKPFYTGRGS